MPVDAIWFPGNVANCAIRHRLTTKYAARRSTANSCWQEFDWEEPATAQPGMAQAQDFKSTMEAARKHLQTHKNFNLDDALRELEKSYVEAALDITRGNLSQAAKLLAFIAPRCTAACRAIAAAGRRTVDVLRVFSGWPMRPSR